MKKRTGFVSNSSSDSFILASHKTAEQFKEWLNKIYRAYSDDDSISLDDEMSVIEVGEEGVDIFQKEMDDFYEGYKHILHGRPDGMLNYIKEIAKENKLHILRVDSTSDNSIPYSIQTIMENNDAVRAHWG
jgi:hypothetical protein